MKVSIALLMLAFRCSYEPTLTPAAPTPPEPGPAEATPTEEEPPAPTPEPAAQKMIDVILLAGQSNAAGYAAGAVDWLPRGDIQYWPRYLGPHAQFEPTQLLPLAPVTANHGLEAYLAPSLADSDGNTVAVIKCARGGSQISQWLPGNRWRYWDEMIEAVDGALAALASDYPDRERRLSLIWIQGENDATEKAGLTAAQAYAGSLRTLTAGLRARYGEGLTTYIVQLNQNFATLPHRALVAAAQAQIVGEHPANHLIPTGSLRTYAQAPTAAATNADNIHYNAAGFRALSELVRSEWMAANTPAE